jgi:ribosome-binding protein aMBF1 (putative translation factor)
MASKKNITTFSEYLDQQYGPEGSLKRKEYERGFELFKIGVMVCQAREDQGMTEQQLADKCGTTKAQVNKIEYEAENVKISALRNIIEKGLGGRLELSFQL